MKLKDRNLVKDLKGVQNKARTYWLDVDAAMANEDFPDARSLQDRIRIASARWPRSVLPERLAALGQAVEDYYESGENSKQRVL